MHIQPAYDLKKIKFATDEATFIRAVGLYESGKVTKVDGFGGYYSAVVLGTKPYHVSVSVRNFKMGHCTCYLGEKGTLCKHMVSLAIHAVLDGKPLNENDKQPAGEMRCGVKGGPLSEEELKSVKDSITDSLKYIKAYRGPSRTWFAYQDSLQEGCNMLSVIVSELPVNRQSAEILVKLLLRLDKKLCVGGVDDSDGTVGGCMSGIVKILEEYVKIDPQCAAAFKQLTGIDTCFQWEEPLIRILDESYTVFEPHKTTISTEPGQNTKFIGKKSAGDIEKIIFKGMPALQDAAERFNLDFKSMIRFTPVSEMCADERNNRKLTVKQIAADMQVPQYRLKDIERSNTDRIIPDILNRYIEYLGLNKRFASWKKQNEDIYKRLSKGG